MTAAQRERLRALIDEATRDRIARAHGLVEEQLTDDPGYVTPTQPRAQSGDPLAWITEARTAARRNGRLPA